MHRRLNKDKKVISSGIPILDSKLQRGGFMEGTVILCIGDASSRKDLFGYRFLMEGIKNGEKVTFYDVEASSDEILDLFNDSDEIEDMDQLDFVDACPEYSKFYINAVPATIIDHMRQNNDSRRVLINPFTFFIERFGVMDAGDLIIRVREIAMQKNITVLLLMANILSDLELQSIMDKCDGIIELTTKVYHKDIFHELMLKKFGSGQRDVYLTYVIEDSKIKVTSMDKIS